MTPKPTHIPGSAVKPPDAARSRWPGLLLALLIGLVVGFFASRAWLANRGLDRYDQLKARFDQLSTQSRADADRLQAQADKLQGELDVELGARKGLEASLATAQRELGRTRDQLAFFRQLFPPGPSGSVNIRALEVRQQGPALAYKVLLSRNAAPGSLFKGSLRFVAQGQEKGKTVKITLMPLRVAQPATPANTDELALSFDQFQRSEGKLALPTGFTPQSVMLSVLEGNAVRVTRTVKLSP
ncbi:MAG TPA: DUF6776 family protein [Burkholderiaceae bacterium]|nr:DUF6776 family protein [Burkholderiaceae bacterium]